MCISEKSQDADFPSNLNQVRKNTTTGPMPPTEIFGELNHCTLTHRSDRSYLYKQAGTDTINETQESSGWCREFQLIMYAIGDRLVEVDHQPPPPPPP